MNASPQILIVATHASHGYAHLAVFLAGQTHQDYGLLLPEHDVGGELFSLVRQYRAQGSVTVTTDRRHQPR